MKPSLLGTLLLAIASTSAHATTGVPLPVSEPGVLELLAIAAVAAIVVAIRKGKK